MVKEGCELSEKIGHLKLESSDGKFYKTDVADTEPLYLNTGKAVKLSNNYETTQHPLYMK
jgi:hypothetical protein